MNIHAGHYPLPTNGLTLGSTIEKAIHACHSESDSKFDVLRNVRESLQREYHDTCGAVNTLRFIGTCDPILQAGLWRTTIHTGEEGRVKVYLAQGELFLGYCYIMIFITSQKYRSPTSS